jgi:hypothetical protein
MLRAPIAALAATIAIPVTASPLIAFEDFETASPKDTSLAGLVTNVGTFTPDPGLNVFVSSPGYTNFGPGLNPTASSILTANGDEGWTLDLAFPAAYIEVTFFLNDLGPATFRLFDASNTQIGSFNFSDSSLDDNKQTIVFSYSENRIVRATWESTLGGRLNTGWDDITIAQIAGGVPEPSSWALLITGFGLTGLALRRQQRRLA